MFGHAWRVGRIGGIEIRIDASWTVIALLVAYSLFLQFTIAYGTLSDPAGLVLAIAATILFFGSVLAHEMTHAMVSRRVGIPVRDITLFIFGGTTHANVDSHGPRDEFWVSVVGPLSSLVLAALFWLGSILGHAFLPHPVEGALGYLGWVNLVLAGFNLLPGFPLDGGRVLRSVVWGLTDDLRRATRVATLAGETIGYVLLVGGVFEVFGGDLTTGIWFAAIGWFLAQSARASYVDFRVRQEMRSVDVDDVMEQGLLSVPADATIQEIVDRDMSGRDRDVFAVERDGTTVGLVTLDLIQAIPRDERTTRLVREAMLPLEKIVAVTPSTPMEAALERLGEGGREFVLVVNGPRAVGLLTVADVARWIRRHDALVAPG